MDGQRKTAIIAGVLFILATLMGTINAGLLGPVLGEANYLTGMSQIADTVNISVLLNLIMAGAVIGIAVVIFPALNRENQTLAIGFLSARTVEGAVLALGGIGWLGLVSLGSAFVQAGQPEGSFYQTVAALLLDGSTAAFTIGAEIFFSLSALILNYIFFRANLVPRFISIWGVIGGFLLLALGTMKILGMPVSAIEIAFTAPIALNEMVLAVWLIARGKL